MQMYVDGRQGYIRHRFALILRRLREFITQVADASISHDLGEVGR